MTVCLKLLHSKTPLSPLFPSLVPLTPEMNAQRWRNLFSIFSVVEFKHFVLHSILGRMRAVEQPIISANSVQKWFRNGKVEVHALRGVDIAVQPGEMVAIMGPSGCGKTTLLNCLSGLDEFDDGEVYIEGVRLSAMNDRERTRHRAQRMGFIFQTYNLLPVITAVENVELPLLVAGMRPSAARKRALEALEQVGLANRAHHRPAELSGGERQRVTVARALVNNPAIVWADEPTGSLDSKTADEIVTLMRTLNQARGQTFVVVTHDPDVAAACNRIIHMRDGRIVYA
ncbi:MAG: hypothetical protein KatS3mg048_1058 [Caldilinea sp.]|nr:MAG: hypothetical protein KatS3mg048_1058 [Caldilinea sp.]